MNAARTASVDDQRGMSRPLAYRMSAAYARIELNDRASRGQTVGILGIDNRTENWRTACVLSPLVERHDARSSLANHLVGAAGQCGDSVEFELFWKGMRDYVHAERQGKGAPLPEHPGGTETRSLELYRDCFPSLRQKVECSFQLKEKYNYLAEGEYEEKLYSNLFHTEIDIVLQTDTHLCIGEAKSSQMPNADSKHVLVHQLIRHYVMARILVELTGSKKEIVPFVVGDHMKNSKQVQFMINWGCLRDSNILSWAQLSDILGREGPASCEPDIERRFNSLAEQWESETAHLSMMSSIVLHRSYQEIIGLGRDVLPLILRRLSVGPNHWFWALRAISGEDPVSAADVGKFDAMRQTWLQWGRNHGLMAVGR